MVSGCREIPEWSSSFPAAGSKSLRERLVSLAFLDAEAKDGDVASWRMM